MIASTDPPSEVLPPSESAIADTGASGFYLILKAPCANINPAAVKILVNTSGGLPHQSSASCNLLLPNLPVCSGHIMPQLHHNLMGIGPLCDHNCRVVFAKNHSKSITRTTTSFSAGGAIQKAPISGGLPFAQKVTPFCLPIGPQGQQH